MFFDAGRDYNPPYTMDDLRKKFSQRVWYALTYRSSRIPEGGKRVLNDLQSSPLLTELPVEKEIASSRSVIVRKYMVRDSL